MITSKLFDNSRLMSGISNLELILNSIELFIYFYLIMFLTHPFTEIIGDIINAIFG